MKATFATRFVLKLIIINLGKKINLKINCIIRYSKNIFYYRGYNVERDFIEAPSQMFENWVWNKDSLKILSSHYKDSSHIDEEILEDLIKNRNSSSGCFNIRYVDFY